MPSPGAPDVTQIGFLTASGALANIADANEATFWKPFADGLDSYPMTPVADNGFVLPGYPRPAIQFDFGENVRISIFRAVTQTPTSLGWCFLLASDLPATTLDNTVQASDIWAGGLYTVEQMNSGVALETRAKTQDIRKRYWRFVFFKQPPAA